MTVKYKRLSFLGFPDYVVGTDGTVWTRKRTRNTKSRSSIQLYGSEWNLLSSSQVSPYGHRSNTLYKNNKSKRILTHRLVLEAFVGPCPERMQARHIDGNATNNNLKNLAWGTPKEDRQDMIKHGNLRYKTFPGEQNYGAKLKSSQVLLIRKLHSQGTPQTELCKQFNLHRSTVLRIVHRLNWKHI